MNTHSTQNPARQFNHKPSSKSLRLGAGLAAACLTLPALAIDADLSDDLANPTVLNLQPGSNAVSNTVISSGGTSPNADIDFITVVVAPGLQLDNVLLSRYEGPAVSFMGFAAGSVLPANTVGSSQEQADFVAQSLGFALLGENHVGSNTLFNLAFGDVTIDPVLDPPERLLENDMRFDPFKPLNTGTYAFVFQDTGPALVTYELDFQTSLVPEPASAGLLAAIGWFAGFRRRRTKN